MPAINPVKGEIWNVKFDPATGAEINKIRPAIVMNIAKAGRLPLRMVVPITSGNAGFRNLFWMVEIEADSSNGLSHDSFADAFQFKSVSVDRFHSQLGEIRSQDLLHEIASAIALCIGYTLPRRREIR